MVVSQKHIAVIDPHRRCIKPKSETSPAGTKKKLSNFFQFRGHVSTFESIFDLNTKGKNYCGTIFRFPLRKPRSYSEISDKVYTPEMVREKLFESLKEESPYILLFLRNVKSISLMEWTKGSTQPHQTFQVTAAINEKVDNDAIEVEGEVPRCEVFAKQCSQSSETDDSEVYLELKSTTVTVTSNDNISCHHWLVLKVVGTNDHKLNDLGKELSILPWVGLASRLPSQIALTNCETTTTLPFDDCTTVETVFEQFRRSLVKSQQSMKWSGESVETSPGHAYCFLPLPECTAMPVHVHGYFAVTDNRRSIKWPAHDEKGKEAQWNRELLQKMVAPAYALLLTSRATLIHYEDTPLPITNTENMTDPYSTWPLYPEVKNVPIWNELLSPTLDFTLPLPLLWTSACGGKWVQFNEAYFLPGSYSTNTYNCSEVVIQLLINLNIPLVSLPTSICETLKENKHALEVVSGKEISPAFVREVVRNSDCCSLLSRVEAYDVLDYILSDLNENNYHDLVDIPLLPLKGDLQMIAFQKPDDHNIKYIFPTQSKALLEIIPGTDHMIVDPELPETINRKLCEISNKQWLQLKEVDTDSLYNTLLPTSIYSWCTNTSGAGWKWVPGESSMPPQTWMNSLWKWIGNSSVNLSALEGLPIIPQLPFEASAQMEQEVTLLKVSQTQNICLISPRFSTKEKSILMQILKKLDFLVVDELKMANKEFPPDFETFIPELNLNLELIIKYFGSSSQTLQSAQLLSYEERDFFRKQVYSLGDSCGKYQSCLKSLPIYQAACSNENSPHFIALSNVYNSQEAFLPPDDMPSLPDYPKGMLRPVVIQEEKLFFKALSVKQLTLSDLCKHHLIPLALEHIRSHPYSWSIGDDLILWILKRHEISDEILSLLSKEAIVYACDSTHKKPQDVHDPQDPILNILFDVNTDKHCLPNEQYFHDTRCSCALLTMGMKTWKDFQNNFEQMCTLLHDRMVSVTSLLPSAQFTRGQFILQKLSELNGSHYSTMNRVQFLMAEDCPPSYPSNLKQLWFGRQNDSTLYSIEDLCLPCSNVHNLVGTVKPILSSDYFRGQYAVSLGSCQNLAFQKITKEAVTNHLKWIQSTTVSENIDSLDGIIMSIYDYLLLHSGGQTLPLIWQRACETPKFISAKQFVLNLPEGLQLNLEPFYYSLQAPIRKYAHLFQLHERLKPADVALVLEKIGNEELTKNQCQVCISILNWLCEKKYKKESMFMLTEDSTLTSAKNCVYDDRNWMKHSKSRGHIKGKSLIFVNDKIPQKVARHFEVVPLSCKVAPSQRLGITYTSAGQHEDITQRIRHIVQDYETNIDIFKELIQNADDAEATEVKFLIDSRHHPKETLITEELKEWQGPALIAYNNATFSDEDFQNILSVAGETKKSNPLKTGRFGVGFCATYHLTDIPSFISRKYFTMFDPHTSYLGDRISSREPGMRVDLVENQPDLELYHDQFAPYEFIFDCDVFDMNGDGYQGTIFRFPFRTEHTGSKSRICSTIYDRKRMLTLTEAMKEQSNELLLFLKHVKKVSLFKLDEGQDARTPCEVFSIERSGSSAERIKVIESYSNSPQKQQEESTCSSIFEIRVFEGSKERSKTCWMLSTAIKSFSYSMQSREEAVGLLPLAEVAIKLDPSGENFKFLPITGFNVNRVFCFLPLPIEIKLPFHVNGFFSVGKDRRNISATDDKTFGSQWNKSLAESSLVTAYLHLLHTLCSECDLNSVSSPEVKKNYLSKYYSLWNFGEGTGLIGGSFVAALRRCIPTLNCPILWSEIHGGCWLSPMQAEMFSDIHLLESVSANDRSKSIKQTIRHDATSLLLKYGHGIVELPLHDSVYELIKDSIISSGRAYNYKKFARELFFPCIDEIDETVRDRNIKFLVEKIGVYQGEHSWYKWAEKFLREEPCIRCQNSSTLRPASQLIDSGNPLFKNLFFVSEGRFPTEELQKSRVAMDGLTKMGMASHRLSIADLKERAKSVMLLDYEHGVERSVYICEYIESTYGKRHYVYNRDNFSETEKQELQQLFAIPFLPIKQKPSDVDVPWIEASKSFESPLQLYAPQYEHLLFSQHLIVDLASRKVLAGLEISLKEPTPAIVIAHLKCIVSHIKSNPDEATVKFLDECIKNIYEYLEKHISSPNVVICVAQLDKFIWQNGCFLRPTEVVGHWKHDCVPYMSELSQANKKFHKLFDTVGVKSEADLEMLVGILQRIAADHSNCTPISNVVLEFVEFTSGRLYHKLFGKDKVEVDSLNIYLPDEKNIMRRVSDLADNVGSDWIRSLPVYQEFISGANGYFVHSSIPRERAIRLGVNPLLEAVVKEIEDVDFLDGTDFGQFEDLCDRLNGILRKYPADISILKEFIQNADDAQASEIAFVLDHRTEFPDSSLLSSTSKWKSLQHTPALCIFNNRKFTEADIEGITKLGRGGKRGSADLIGKFGIGFNVAYHVTDCPSFVSYSESGTPEYLCVFDPTQTFAPCATRRSPGRKWNFKSSHHYSGFPDQFKPYLSEDLPQLSEHAPDCLQDYKECGYVVFRLPLTRYKKSGLSYVRRNTKLTSGSLFFPSTVSQLFKEFAAISEDMLLFLNHLRKVSAFEILKDGKCVHHFTTTASIPSKYSHKCLQFSHSLKHFSKAICEGRSCKRVSVPYIVDIVHTQPDHEAQKAQWLVQRVIDGGNIQMKLLQDALSQDLRPIAGVATRLMSLSADHKYLLFCFLPLPIQSNLPVHVNAHFLLDDSRKHLESIPQAGLENWNETIAEKVIVPAYVDLIMTVKDMLNDGTVVESHDFYYSLFPKSHSTISNGVSEKTAEDESEKDGEMSNLNIVNVFYCELLQQNPSLLIREMPTNASVHQWMNMKDSLFCTSFICGNTWLTLGEDLRITLVLLGLPITNAPNFIYHQCVKANDSYSSFARVTPDKVIQHLTELCNTITAEQLEMIKKNLNELLYFCISGYAAHNIPALFVNALYLLAMDGSLQQEFLFRSNFSHLLPHCQRNFIDKTLESSEVGQTLRKCNVIRALPLNFLSDQIRLPTTYSMCDLSDSDQNIVRYLWEYLKNYSTQSKHNLPKLIRHYFSQKAIIPTSDCKLYPVRLSKTLVRQHCSCENCSVMKKLGYSQIDFGKIRATYMVIPRDIITDLTSCFQDGLNVLECFVLKAPTHFDVELKEHEVLSFITSLGKAPQHHLQQFSNYFLKMRLFHTIDELPISLCGVTKVFVLAASNLPLEGIQTTRNRQVILKAPASPLIKKFYEGVIPRNISEGVNAEDFYMKIVLPILPELQVKNIITHIEFLYLHRNDMERAFSMLKKTSFIKHNDQLYEVCELCDHTVNFFKLFKPHLVLPTPWQEKLEILKCLGLQTKVTESEWLQCARKFSITAACDQNAEKKSTVLLNELKSIIKDKYQHSLSDGHLCHFLNNVADIEFIYSLQSSTELNKILTVMFPKVKRSSHHNHHMMQFKGSVSPQEANLTCLSKHVLPDNCLFMIKNPKIKQYLGIEHPVSPAIVAMNLKHVCNCVSTSFGRFQSASSLYIKRLIDIFDEHYAFLSASKLSASSSIIDALKDECCILRSKSPLLLQLLKPSQLVMHLPSDCTLEPYCYRIEPWLQKHADFLTALGVKQELKAQDYINIFDKVQRELEGDSILPTKVIECAYKEVISRLRRGDNIKRKSDIVIYLPDEELKPTKISELCHGDVPWYKNRLPQNFSLKMILEPPTDDKGHRTLPECLNIQRLSDIVVEELHENCKCDDLECTDEKLFKIGKRSDSDRCIFVKGILETLKSDELFHGFCRMYYTQYKSPPSESFKLSVQHLKQVSVRCINSELKTVLTNTITGQAIPGTEDPSKLCHLCCDGDSFTLYIAPHCPTLEGDDLPLLFKDLAVCINKVTDNELANMGPISAVFECTPNEIPQTLTREHVFDYSQDGTVSTKAIVIGTSVPWGRFDPKESLVIINFDPEDPIRFLRDDGSLINAEIVKGGHSGLLDSKLTVRIEVDDDNASDEASDSDSSEIVVSPLQVFKVLTSPQKRSLWSRTTSPYAAPLALEAVPLDNEGETQQWLRKVMQPYSGLVQKVLSLRLVAHIHYQGVMQGKSPLLIRKVMQDLLELCEAKHNNIEHSELVVSLIKTTIEKLTTEDALNDIQATFPSKALADIMNTNKTGTPVYFGNNLPHYGGHDVLPSTSGSRYLSQSSYTSAPITASASSHNPLQVGGGFAPQLNYPFQTTPALGSTGFGPQQGSGVQLQSSSSRFASSRSRSRHAQRSRFQRFTATHRSVPPQPDICLRSRTAWLEQAKSDYNAALLLLEGTCVSQADAGTSVDDKVVTECKFPALVCFLCHDVVEKCIKGVFYAYCGLTPDLVTCNNLVTLYDSLTSSRHLTGHPMLKDIQECVMTLSSHEHRSRFPNYQNPPCAPASIYDVEDAQEAYEATLKLLRVLQSQDKLYEDLRDLGQLPERRFMSVLQSMPNNQGTF